MPSKFLDIKKHQPMKRVYVFTLALSAVLLLSVSCKKRCNIPDSDSYSGNVVWVDEEAGTVPVIYPSSGYMTDNMNGDYHIDANHLYAEYFDVSFDGGITRAPVNMSSYNILAYPLLISCDAAVERTVTVDDANGFVSYHLKVHECNQGCDEKRFIENYVLVPAFPESYNVVYTVE